MTFAVQIRILILKTVIDKNKIYLFFFYNFDISDERHLVKFFGYITASYCLINEKFGSKK